MKVRDWTFEQRLREHFGEGTEKFSGHLRGLLHSLWRDGVDLGANRMCGRCGSRDQVKLESARTQYCPSETDPDPNADVPLCRPCAEEHHDYWNEMWNEYYAGRL